MFSLNHIRQSQTLLPFSEMHLFTCQTSLFAALIGLGSDSSAAAGNVSSGGGGGADNADKSAGGDGGGDTDPSAASAPASSSPVDSTYVQMAFLFSVLWGLCCTLAPGVRSSFDGFFRNLVDGLVKGHPRPGSFRLGRANLIPDNGSVFDYTLDVDRPGCWVKWGDQVIRKLVCTVRRSPAHFF